MWVGPRSQPLGSMAREISLDEYTLLEYNSFLGKGKIKLITLPLRSPRKEGL